MGKSCPACGKDFVGVERFCTPRCEKKGEATASATNDGRTPDCLERVTVSVTHDGLPSAGVTLGVTHEDIIQIFGAYMPVEAAKLIMNWPGGGPDLLRAELRKLAGGLCRKYASNAERQKAYRERRRNAPSD